MTKKVIAAQTLVKYFKNWYIKIKQELIIIKDKLSKNDFAIDKSKNRKWVINDEIKISLHYYYTLWNISKLSMILWEY